MVNARLIALKVLLDIENNGSYSNIAIDKALKRENISKLDSAFACNIIYGVLERKIQLDYVISKYCKKPTKKLPSDIINILRIGVYQILFMDKVPNSAAVNETVNLSKIIKKRSASGFINAVLRNIIRANDKLPIPSKDREPIKYLSVKYSFPENLVEFFRKSYGSESLENLLSSLIQKPALIARVNTIYNTTQELIQDLKEESVIAKPCILDDAIELFDSGDITKLRAFKEGRFHIQDLASQILCAIINPKPEQTVIDICSAPGGKAFTMAEIMNNQGEIFAFDLYEHKVKLICDGATRLGLSIINSEVRDALNEDKDIKNADIVLCDVPCSGLGVIRRKPEIKYNVDMEKLDNLPILQYRILCNAEKFVKVGGTLVYSTCTLNPAENKGVSDRFLMEHNNYAPVKISHKCINRTIHEPDNQLTLMPYANNTDGFFISMFKKLR